MRHANSPRHPRRLFSSRRFRHTAVSPPPCIRAMHSCRTGPGSGPAPAGGDRRANRNARDSLTFTNFAWLTPFASSREDTAYLVTD